MNWISFEFCRLPFTCAFILDIHPTWLVVFNGRSGWNIRFRLPPKLHPPIPHFLLKETGFGHGGWTPPLAAQLVDTPEWLICTRTATNKTDRGQLTSAYWKDYTRMKIQPFPSRQTKASSTSLTRNHWLNCRTEILWICGSVGILFQ